MKWTSCLIFLLGFYSSIANAQVCSAEKVAEVLAPNTTGTDVVYVNCNLNLSSTDVVTKTIAVRGIEGRGVNINCNNALIDGYAGGADRFAVIIRSTPFEDTWRPVYNVTVQNCRIRGDIRVRGMPYEDVKQSSFSLGHTERTQAAAPYNITLQNNQITSTGKIHLYVESGVTRVSVLNNTFRGTANSATIYLDAESGNHTIRGNTFAANSTAREILAIDGSASNKIITNVFYNTKGGVFLYRNCGERGVVRHQTPSFNQIINNVFYNRSSPTSILGGGGNSNPGRDANYAIHVASRNGRPNYCNEDNGYNFGSSINNRDLAKENAVAQNQIFNATTAAKIVNDENPNYYFANQTVSAVQQRKAGCFVESTKSFVLDSARVCVAARSNLCQDGTLIDQGTACN